MPNSGNCVPPLATPQTRPHWRPGSYLTSAASALEQNYRLQKLRRHNRKMHGWGVLCGLWVVPAVDATHPWGIRICPGYAIGPYGDEIEVPIAVQVNIEDFLWYKPDAPFAGIAVIPQIALVAIRYQDFTDDLTVVPNAACQCDDPDYVPDRIGDGYQAGVVWTTPTLTRGIDATTPPTATPTPTPTRTTPVCRPESTPCPPCPDSPWVILAAIQLPQRGIPITADMINNGFRSSV
jgi:hypothetical protein